MLGWFSGKKEEKKTASGSSESKYSSDSFKVRLVTAAGRLVPGDLENIEMDGVIASFPTERCPELNEEAETKLEFTKIETEREFVIRAVVKEALKTKDQFTYTFSFPDPKLFISELDAEDFSAANRRQSFRMEPLDEDEIIVDLSWDKSSAKGWLNDISVTGMGLGIIKPTAIAMGKPAELKLSFKLPGNEERLELIGKVLYHKPGKREGTVHCGVLFEQNIPGGFLVYDKAISTFLSNQQKELLKRRARRD